MNQNNDNTHSNTINNNQNKETQSPIVGLVAPLQRIRRRLTVTGDSETIDGVSKLSVSEEKEDTAQQFHPSIRCAVSNYSGVSKKGHAPYNPRKKNQDALIMINESATNSVILCVLDGHGEHGDGVATTFERQLPNEIITHPSWATDIKKACAEAIAKVEQRVITNYNIDTEFSGTTLSMAIIRGNKITGVNIGDSRVIIGKQIDGKLVAEEFTHDHKPDVPIEKSRIIASGGRVFAVEYDDGVDGPPRVWLGHMDVPGLAMSRSLGDSVAHSVGVTSEPEFTERDLDPSTDKFVVVATDGLWEFITNDETAQMVTETSTPTGSVDILTREACKRWMEEEQLIDDTTIITAYLFDYKPKC